MGKTLRALRLCRMQRAAVQTADLCRGVADKKREEARGSGHPHQMIDRYDAENPCPYFVGCDNTDASMRVVEALLKLGHRRIRFVSYNFFLSSEQARFDGYCTAMRHAGYTVQAEDLLSHRDMDRLVEAVRTGACTALVCCNDKLAGKVLHVLLENGVRIPEEVSVFGFDDWEKNRELPMGLSTMRQDFEEIGGMAANLLCSVIQGHFKKGRKEFLSKAELLLRDTVGPAPEK